jgi:hypothetical protein
LRLKQSLPSPRPYATHPPASLCPHHPPLRPLLCQVSHSSTVLPPNPVLSPRTLHHHPIASSHQFPLPNHQQGVTRRSNVRDGEVEGVSPTGQAPRRRAERAYEVKIGPNFSRWCIRRSRLRSTEGLLAMRWGRWGQVKGETTRHRQMVPGERQSCSGVTLSLRIRHKAA